MSEWFMGWFDSNPDTIINNLIKIIIMEKIIYIEGLEPNQIKKAIYTVDRPKEWREGQYVFNAAEMIFGGFARQVQFEDGVDCFYNDEMIDEFIKYLSNRIKEYNK